jgi:hypothetical protein
MPCSSSSDSGSCRCSPTPSRRLHGGGRVAACACLRRPDGPPRRAPRSGQSASRRALGVSASRGSDRDRSQCARSHARGHAGREPCATGDVAHRPRATGPSARNCVPPRSWSLAERPRRMPAECPCDQSRTATCTVHSRMTDRQRSRCADRQTDTTVGAVSTCVHAGTFPSRIRTRRRVSAD